MKEHPFFFGDPKRQLFGVFHYSGDQYCRTAFVFCHPYAEEKLWAHRSYVSLARMLAAHGYPVLRFDFMGHGDSLGDFAESDINSRLDDTSKAIDQVLSLGGVDSVVLFGLRFGGTIAAQAAEINSKVSSLVLWEPIVDGRQYMQQMLRSNLSTQMAVFGKIQYNRKQLVEQIRAGESVDIEGYPLTGRMYDQAEQMHLDQRKLKRSIPAFVLQLSPKEDAQENKKLRALTSQYGPGNMEIVREEPFWREIRRWYSSAANAQAATLKWVEVNCA